MFSLQVLLPPLSPSVPGTTSPTAADSCLHSNIHCVYLPPSSMELLHASLISTVPAAVEPTGVDPPNLGFACYCHLLLSASLLPTDAAAVTN